MMAREGGVLALDLGGTWIKALFRPGGASESSSPELSGRWPNPCRGMADVKAFGAFLAGVCRELVGDQPLSAVCVATAGEIGPDFRSYRISAPHLGVMATNGWQEEFSSALNCPVWLLNDADAFMLGAAGGGLIPKAGAVAGLLLGTGVGYSLVREGRWWKPSRSLNFLGAIRTPEMDFDHMASAARLSESVGGDLVRLFTDPGFARELDAYAGRLAAVAASACALYHLDRIILGGGIAEAADAAGYSLAARIQSEVSALLPRVMKCPEFHAAGNANRLILEGALDLAAGNAVAEQVRFHGQFAGLDTERRSPVPNLDGCPAPQIVRALWEEEQKAGAASEKCLERVAEVAESVAEACRVGGRVILVGAGTSGRVAALDAVEMPCTYGVPRWQFVAVIAGGVSDSAISIEDQFEEDQSSVSDLLLLAPGAQDIVIGISASGTAFFVRSALAFARSKGAKTVLLHESPVEDGVSEILIPLCSGPEVISGSTRMKAGTATKKILNYIGTTAMVLLGKTREGWMIDFDPCNEKLEARAAKILSNIHGISIEAAREVLMRHGGNLRAALDGMPSNQ